MGYRLNRLDEPIFMAGPKPLRTEFGIHLRLESCAKFSIAYIPILDLNLFAMKDFSAKSKNELNSPSSTLSASGHWACLKNLYGGMAT